MHVVFGAGGRAGGETARSLLAKGEAVRVVVRRPEQGEPWKARGAEVAIADLEDADSVTAALKRARAAFFLNPPPVAGDPFESTAKVSTALVKALRQAALPKAVILSSIGAQHDSGTGVIATLNRFEAALAGTGPALTFLRSGYFVETFEEVAEPAVAEGALPTFIKLDQKVAMVSTIDVGAAAAQLLSDDGAGKRIVELSGPEDWSARDVAAAFAAVLGRSVEPVFVPSGERAAALAEAGIPPEVAGALLGMYEGIANGLFVRQDCNEQWRGKTSLKAAVERLVAKVR